MISSILLLNIMSNRLLFFNSFGLKPVMLSTALLAYIIDGCSWDVFLYFEMMIPSFDLSISETKIPRFFKYSVKSVLLSIEMIIYLFKPIVNKLYDALTIICPSLVLSANFIYLVTLDSAEPLISK